MKKFFTWLTFFVFSLVIIILCSISFVRRSTFYNEDYYLRSVARIDSLRKDNTIMKGRLMAGFSKVGITPVINSPEDNYPEGKFMKVPLAGFGDRKGQPATGVLDSIFVKAAALKTDDNLIVFVCADLLIMPAGITGLVMSMLAESGIKREQLFFSATHTHSGIGGWEPGIIGKLFAGEENINIQKWVANQIAGAVTLAISDLKPACIGYGSFNAEIYTRNRLRGGSGTKNNDFTFIVAEQTGHRKAVIGSFSAHATILGSDNMEISADYPGYWARRIEATTADLALFAAGATGSQSVSSAGNGNGAEKARKIGEALADSLNKKLPLTSMSDQVTYSSVSLKMHLPDYHLRLTKTMNLSSFWSGIILNPPDNVYLQALRLNNLIWITTPSDFSGEYALQIRNNLAAEGFSANVTSFNGSYVGYILPGKYFYLNGYETKMMSWLGPDMGEYTMEVIRQLSRIVSGTKNI